MAIEAAVAALSGIAALSAAADGRMLGAVLFLIAGDAALLIAGWIVRDADG